ncbi:MAG TPA: hypothetical protein VHY08_29870 [Bacillota bacterium]|nr:hypothetical protein [Bacillota bacterium]
MRKTATILMTICLFVGLHLNMGAPTFAANQPGILDTGPSVIKDIPVVTATFKGPKKLTINGFTITDITYNYASTPNCATGKGKMSFERGSSFEITFDGISYEGNDDSAKITGGSISSGLTPEPVVEMGGISVRVTKIKLTEGSTKVDLRVFLPALWIREENAVAKKGYFDIDDIPTAKNLEIYASDKTVNLKEMDLGETNIILKNQNSKVTLDFSATKPTGGINPAWMGVIFDKMETKTQSARKDSNIGFCFGSYQALNATVTKEGLNGDFALQEGYTYKTSMPVGFKLSLNRKGAITEPSDVQVTDATMADGQKTNTAPGFDFSKIPVAADLLNLVEENSSKVDYFGEFVQPNLNIPQITTTPFPYAITSTSQIPRGTLRMIGGKIVAGHYGGTIYFPDSVSKLVGGQISSPFDDFWVGPHLNMWGLLNYDKPICWGKTENQTQVSYGILPKYPGLCYFPSEALPKYDLTKTDPNTQQEVFNSDKPQNPYFMPGVTFYSFILGIATNDARLEFANNAKAIVIPFLVPEVVKKYIHEAFPEREFYWPFRGESWLNIGAAGAGGKMDIESALGYHDYPIDLGNPNNPNNGPQFKSYLHPIPNIQNPAAAPWYEHYGQIDKPEQIKWGKFFQANFVDNTVFNLGVDGHFEVAGPAKLLGGISGLSATSTGELTSSRVVILGQLDYWGVTLKTAKSRFVPKAAEVFLVGSEITELAHYAQPFPVVWGEMTGDGNVPSLIFGYSGQSFDGMPYTYRNVGLSPYKPNENGALITEGDVYFPYFGLQQMTITDFNRKDKAGDPIYRGRQITIKVKPINNNYFKLCKEWGDSGGSQATLDFPNVRYCEAEQNGFIQTDGHVDIKNYVKKENGIYKPAPLDCSIRLNMAGVELKIQDNAEHVIKQSETPKPNEVKVTGLHGNILLDYYNLDSLPELKLKGTFTKDSPVLGGFGPGSVTKDSSSPNPPPSNECDISIRPVLSPYEITGDFNLTLGAYLLKGTATLKVVFTDRIFDGTIGLQNVKFIGPLSGKCSGQFNAHLEDTAKYAQGYAEATVYGMPLVNSGAGAFYIGYGAQKEALFALDFIDDGLENQMLGDLTTVDGFYLAAKLGFNCDLISPFVSAHAYVFGGMGLFAIPQNKLRLLYHGGANVGAEVMAVGVDATAMLRSSVDKDPSELNADFKLQVSGGIRFCVRLLFFKYSWSGDVKLVDEGIELI